METNKMNRNESNFKTARTIMLFGMLFFYIGIIALKLGIDIFDSFAIQYYSTLMIICALALAGISWLVCILWYWLYQFEGKENNREQKIRCVLCIAYMTICGFFSNVSFFNTTIYIAANRNLLDIIWKYVLFYCIMTAVWIIGFICSIRYNEKIRTPGMAKKWILVVCTIGILLLSAFIYVSRCYVEETTDDIYWDINYKHIEMYGETFPRN